MVFIVLTGNNNVSARSVTFCHSESKQLIPVLMLGAAVVLRPSLLVSCWMSHFRGDVTKLL